MKIGPARPDLRLGPEVSLRGANGPPEAADRSGRQPRRSTAAQVDSDVLLNFHERERGYFAVGWPVASCFVRILGYINVKKYISYVFNLIIIYFPLFNITSRFQNEFIFQLANFTCHYARSPEILVRYIRAIYMNCLVPNILICKALEVEKIAMI